MEPSSNDIEQDRLRQIWLDSHKPVTELPPDGVDNQESWDIKAFSANDVADMIKDARARFKEEAHSNWPLKNCTVCHVQNQIMDQHWNDVGGPGTVQCEMCWVDGFIWFWMNEIALGDNPTTPQK
jgi:hypothetical protein